LFSDGFPVEMSEHHRLHGRGSDDELSRLLNTPSQSLQNPLLHWLNEEDTEIRLESAEFSRRKLEILQVGKSLGSGYCLFFLESLLQEEFLILAAVANQPTCGSVESFDESLELPLGLCRSILGESSFSRILGTESSGDLLIKSSLDLLGDLVRKP